MSLSKEWLGFAGKSDPEKQESRKQRSRKLDELTGACARKISDTLLPSLEARATVSLPGHDWSFIVSPDEAQTLLFRYPTALPTIPDAEYIPREVRIECGARSDAWPADDRIIQPYVARAYPEAIRAAAVPVRVLSIARTFWEKATILHAEANRPPDKATPGRFSRHYADLAALADHPEAAAALNRDDLRSRVVEHKRVFFPASWAKYETAVPGSFLLVPPANRLARMEADYREMQLMCFGKPKSWDEIVTRLTSLEAAINAPRK